MQERFKLQRAALADFGLFAFRCEDIDRLLHRATELVSKALEVPFVRVLEATWPVWRMSHQRR